MLDNRTIEMIHADIDRELGVAESAELDALLESSAEAREMRSELLRLSNILNAVPDQAPPPELTRQILQQIQLPRRHSAFSISSLFSSFQPVATAAAFAAGLLLTIGFYEMAPRHATNSDMSQMVGTAIANRQNHSNQGSEKMLIEETWLNGSVSLQNVNGILVLNFDLDSPESVEVELGLLNAGLVFAGIAQPASTPGMANEFYQVSGGALRVRNQGRQSFTVFLRDAASEEGSQGINIEFSSGGDRLVRGTMRSS